MICSNWSAQNDLLKLVCSKWSAQNGLLKMLCSKWSAQIGLLKMVSSGCHGSHRVLIRLGLKADHVLVILD